MSEPITRREIVKRTALLTALPMAAATAGATLAGCARILTADRRIALPAPDRAGNTVFAKALAPELANVGGGVVLTFPDGSNWRPALIANTGAGLVAVQGDCPHEACDLTWVQSDKEVECPCHGSRFASDGTLLNPPAAADLLAFTIEADGANYTVHLAPGDGFYPPTAADGTLTLDVADYPALAAPGGSVSGSPQGYFAPLLIIRDDATTVTALSAKCPHLGCYVQRQRNGFHCPCHGSAFTLSGALVPGSGPAEANLTPIKVNSFDPAAGVIVVQIL